MSTADQPRGVAGRRPGGLRPALLAAAGAWAMVPPYLGPAIGLDLDVAARVEVVDHVVPGAVALAASAAILALGRRGRGPESLPGLVAAGAAFLAGFWITSTHVPLPIEAAEGTTGWGPALLHFSAGPPVVALSLWLLLAPGGGRERAGLGA